MSGDEYLAVGRRTCAGTVVGPAIAVKVSDFQRQGAARPDWASSCFLFRRRSHGISDSEFRLRVSVSKLFVSELPIVTV